MFQPQEPHSRWEKLEYVVAESDAQQGVANRYDFADNPCQADADEECAEWLRQRLSECYND